LTFKRCSLGEPENPTFMFDLRGGIPNDGMFQCPSYFEQAVLGLARSDEQSSECTLLENSQQL
jgi:hypothetical protein